MKENLGSWLSYGLIFTVSILIWFGCGGGRNQEAKVYHTYLSADPTTLDPALSNDAGSGELCALLYDGLVRFGAGTEILPDIAESWDISADSKTYTFHLRPGVRFTNGREVTAWDFKYSFERVLNPKSKSSRGWVFQDILGAVAFLAGKAMGAQPEKAILYFLGSGTSRSIPTGEKETEQTKRRLAEIISAIGKGEFGRTSGSQCGQCEYLTVCSPSGGGD